MTCENMQLTNLLYMEQDLHSKNLPSPFSLTHSDPKLVQAEEEHTAGAKELADRAREKDLELIILKKDDKKGIESI